MRLIKITSLKARMILYLAVVLVISMLLSTLTAFLYFWGVTRKQHIRDEQAKLQLIAEQLNFKAEDVINFANSIAVDATIQEQLIKSDFETEFQKVKSRQQVADRLIFYNTLRNYILTANILGENGNAYNSRGFQNADYFEQRFSEPALLEYIQKSDSVFSSIYLTADLNTLNPVVCYKLPIRAIQNPSRTIGTLYLEIRAGFFQQELEQFSKGYDNLIFTNGNGQVLYEKNSQPSVAIEAPQHAGVKRISGGYLISEYAEAADWTVGIVLTNAAIREQASFVVVFFVLFFFLTLALMLATIHPVLSRIVKPITDLTNVMGTVREGNLAVSPRTDTHDEIALLYQGFNDMLEDIRQYIHKQQMLERQKREMEFDILLSQINPHYLYNVLNTVVYLAAAEKNHRIVEVVNAQIRILQENLKVGEDVIYTTIREEMAVIESYLSIQKYRYSDLFEFQADIDEALMERRIPKAILQPLVENALYHGIVPKDEKGLIQLTAWIENGRLIITVRDNGAGMDSAQIERINSGGEITTRSGGRKHIGLINARERIAFLYGSQYGIKIESVPDSYTIIRIELPA